MAANRALARRAVSSTRDAIVCRRLFSMSSTAVAAIIALAKVIPPVPAIAPAVSTTMAATSVVPSMFVRLADT